MSDLLGQNVVVLDLETARSADDCRVCGQPKGHCKSLWDPVSMNDGHVFTPIGWDRKVDLGLSIGCVYDYLDGSFSWFDMHTLEATVRLFVERQPLLVSFNGIQFDFALMRALLRYGADALKEHALPGIMRRLSRTMSVMWSKPGGSLKRCWSMAISSEAMACRSSCPCPGAPRLGGDVMAGRTVRIETTDGPIHAIVCSRGARARTCIVCHRPEGSVAIKLCDFPLRGQKAGQTCDRVVCVDHAHHLAPDTDYCPAHARLLEAGVGR